MVQGRACWSRGWRRWGCWRDPTLLVPGTYFSRLSGVSAAPLTRYSQVVTVLTVDTTNEPQVLPEEVPSRWSGLCQGTLQTL